MQSERPIGIDACAVIDLIETTMAGRTAWRTAMAGRLSAACRTAVPLPRPIGPTTSDFAVTSLERLLLVEPSRRMGLVDIVLTSSLLACSGESTSAIGIEEPEMKPIALHRVPEMSSPISLLFGGDFDKSLFEHTPTDLEHLVGDRRFVRPVIDRVFGRDVRYALRLVVVQEGLQRDRRLPFALFFRSRRLGRRRLHFSTCFILNTY
ncbi:hypothetical protein WK39_18250 [Burkholderia cepacia]|nr:hypothetical protein WK39_18250 [Burkholderia cepacia]KVS63545.1 hypothetical protein WK40_00270 [Burkholderia cepacia]